MYINVHACVIKNFQHGTERRHGLQHGSSKLSRNAGEDLLHKGQELKLHRTIREKYRGWNSCSQDSPSQQGQENIFNVFN